MLAFFSYAVAATMSAVAAWRLPALLYGDAHRRALWGCYAGFAAALWLKSPAVKNWLNHSPVIDLSVLLKHYVSTAAILAILTYVVASYGASDAKDVPRHVAVSVAVVVPAVWGVSRTGVPDRVVAEASGHKGGAF